MDKPRDPLEDIRTTRRSIEARMVADSTKEREEEIWRE